MKEIQVIAWCDGSHEFEGQVPATQQVTVQIDRLKAKTIDLCETCHKEMIEPLRETLIEFGVDPTGALPKASTKAMRKESTSIACPEPGCDVEAGSRPGLGVHVSKKHGKKLADYE